MLRIALLGDEAVRRYASLTPRLRDARVTAMVSSEDRGTATRLLPDAAATVSLDLLLADHAASFDAVILPAAGPNRQRHALSAAAAGKHVLIEGPLDATRDEAVQLVSACRASRAKFMVGQELRFSAAAQVIKTSLNEGRLGEPGLVRIHRWEPRVESAVSGAGSTRQHLAAEIDLACWLFAARPDVIYATRSGMDDRPPDEFDYMQVHLGFAGGGMALIDFSATLPAGDGYFSLSLIGSTGAAYADDHHNKHLLLGGGPAAAIGASESTHARLQQLQEFVDAVEGNREPSGTVQESQRAADVADAVKISLASRKAVHPGRGP